VLPNDLTPVEWPYFDNRNAAGMQIPVALAHRGFTYDANGKSNRLENSMRAFQAAINLGYRYLETDLHGSKDGVAVVCHDPTLSRTTDTDGAINELTWDEISTARIGGTEPVPRLEEIFETWPDVKVNIDIKDDSAVKPAAEAIEKCGAHDRVGLTSFSSARRKRTESLLSKPVAAGSGTPDTVAFLAAVRLRSDRLARRALRDVDCMQLPVSHEVGPVNLPVVDKAMIESLHGMGKFIHVWTVDEPAEMERLLDLGVDGLITNRAELLRDVLINRGQWY
jgi:glycerophosphoryl diester phosphodiesterase